ncbi:hypothetical protein SMACR_12664 [Sordaria macrospora]|jgi:hypothetical protein|uniref:WGS project CABT00000000 data, contig 2.1583 n=2 Tax=Sordaria macrospora TaxID=5147 RepID=F7WD36_SORMK|nr:uncharacterized protein SMAC_12664 [Sordaria macrospora k-hell]KAA8628028.1 hypothetical protein SMACR_12664 [Sordaria macrospora]CCC14783.1 unnamed protein product [Sordaria macrospora k-hell]
MEAGPGVIDPPTPPLGGPGPGIIDAPTPPPLPVYLPVFPNYIRVFDGEEPIDFPRLGRTIVLVFINWALHLDLISGELNIRNPDTNRIIPVQDDMLDYARRLIRYTTSQLRSRYDPVLMIIRPLLPQELNLLLNVAYRTFRMSSQQLTELVDVQGGLYDNIYILSSLLG